MKIGTISNNMKPKVTVSKLEHEVRCGDWRDKPLRWAVKGPAVCIENGGKLSLSKTAGFTEVVKPS